MATVKQIQAELDAFKRRQRWWQIGFGVAVVLFIVLWLTVFSKKDGPEESYRLQVQQMDSTIKAHERNIEVINRFVLMLDSSDVKLEEKLKANRPKETVIIKQYEKVPADVRSLSRAELERELSKYDY